MTRHLAAVETMRPKLIGLTLSELAAYRFAPRRSILHRNGVPVFRAGHIGQVVADRGIGKTWLLQTLGIVAATGISALGFECPEPVRVLNVDGEMSSDEIQERYISLCERLAVPLDAPITIVGADWQDEFLPRVDTADGQAALEPFVEQADLIIFDNRSCLFDAESEKDPTAWMPAQAYLLSLRRRGKAVLLGHHANRQGGARGHSKAEDVFNLILNLARPDGYRAEQGARFSLTFPKTRGVHGDAVAPFTAALVTDGWRVEAAEDETDQTTRKLREYLTLANHAGERPRSANAAIGKAGVNRNRGLSAWGQLLESGQLVKDADGGFHLVRSC